MKRGQGKSRRSQPFLLTLTRMTQREIDALFARWPPANDWYVGQGDGVMQCCTGNGSRALYYVWENILQHAEGKLRIHLLLNRGSPWADVDSHVPYIGQVDVKIKQPVDLSMRIPEWVRPAQVRLQVNGLDRGTGWDGRYTCLGDVNPGDTVTMSFPISERTEETWVQKEKFTLTRKGNDVVAIDPPGSFHPLYQRDHYREDRTRWREVERFVAERTIYH